MKGEGGVMGLKLHSVIHGVCGGGRGADGLVATLMMGWVYTL